MAANITNRTDDQYSGIMKSVSALDHAALNQPCAQVIPNKPDEGKQPYKQMFKCDILH